MTIWTINGVIILLGLILVTGLLSYGAIRDFTRPGRSNIGLEEVSVVTSSEDQWSLGRVMKVPGSSFARVDLTSNRDAVDSSKSELGFFGSGGSSYSRRTAKNILFIDLEANESRWLFPSNSQLIISTRGVDENGLESESTFTQAFLYSVVSSDTNLDGRLDADDDLVVSASRPDGTNYSELLTDVQRIIGTAKAGSDKLLIVYQKNSRALTAVFDTPTLQIEQGVPLPVVGR